MKGDERNENSVLVTITGLAHYYGTKPFKVGAVIKLKKEYDNKYDDEAIRAQLCRISVQSVTSQTVHIRFILGTYSAGRLYDKIGECVCENYFNNTFKRCCGSNRGLSVKSMGECVFE